MSNNVQTTHMTFVGKKKKIHNNNVIPNSKQH